MKIGPRDPYFMELESEIELLLDDASDDEAYYYQYRQQKEKLDAED